MGQHRKPRKVGSPRDPGGAPGRGRRPEQTPASQPDADPASREPDLPHHVGARALQDLADVARVARRTGWSFGSSVLASADTGRVRRPRPVSSADGLPRRYATQQPTAPMIAIRSR
jgi:hypothetical protein